MHLSEGSGNPQVRASWKPVDHALPRTRTAVPCPRERAGLTSPGLPTPVLQDQDRSRRAQIPRAYGICARRERSRCTSTRGCPTCVSCPTSPTSQFPLAARFGDRPASVWRSHHVDLDQPVWSPSRSPEDLAPRMIAISVHRFRVHPESVHRFDDLGGLGTARADVSREQCAVFLEQVREAEAGRRRRIRRDAP